MPHNPDRAAPAEAEQRVAMLTTDEAGRPALRVFEADGRA
jgi:hypothetical protein